MKIVTGIRYVCRAHCPEYDQIADLVENEDFRCVIPCLKQYPVNKNSPLMAVIGFSNINGATWAGGASIMMS